MRVRCGAICLIALFAASSDQETGAELKTRCGGLLILYPLCRWFAEVKRRRRDWWLSYL
jgi:hypothetical protein